MHFHFGSFQLQFATTCDQAKQTQTRWSARWPQCGGSHGSLAAPAGQTVSRGTGRVSEEEEEEEDQEEEDLGG